MEGVQPIVPWPNKWQREIPSNPSHVWIKESMKIFALHLFLQCWNEERCQWECLSNKFKRIRLFQWQFLLFFIWLFPLIVECWFPINCVIDDRRYPMEIAYHLRSDRNPTSGTTNLLHYAHLERCCRHGQNLLHHHYLLLENPLIALSISLRRSSTKKTNSFFLWFSIFSREDCFSLSPWNIDETQRTLNRYNLLIWCRYRWNHNNGPTSISFSIRFSNPLLIYLPLKLITRELDEYLQQLRKKCLIGLVG